MGRKSKLTDKQWEDVQQRLLDGQSIRSVAKFYDVAESSIRERKSAHVTEIKKAADTIVASKQALARLPLSAQVSAHNLADRLISISNHLAGAAEYGAATAHRLSGIAHSKVQEIDDVSPLDEQGLETIKGIAALTRMANEASQIGVNLISANKERMSSVRDVENPTLDVSKLSSQTRRELLESRGTE